MATTGNTVRLSVQFTDWDGVNANPDANSVVFRVYDNDHVQVGTDVPLSDGTYRVGTGLYRYEYVVPAGSDNLFVEFSATSGSKPIVVRQRIDREFYT